MKERDFRTYVQETVTITRPLPSTYARGVHASSQNLPAVSVRMPQQTRDTIEDASALIGVNKSEFIRWCAHQVALDILKQHAEFKKL